MRKRSAIKQTANSSALTAVLLGSFLTTEVAAAIRSASISQSAAEGVMKYATQVEAVAAATNLYNPLSIADDVEYMGVILADATGYRYTVARGERGKDSISIRIPKAEWGNVVAFWHTHGKAESHYRYFSDIDTELTERTGIPFYLADYTGRLKVFNPGDNTLARGVAIRLGLPASRGFALGNEVRDQQNEVVKVSTRLQEGSARCEDTLEPS